MIRPDLPTGEELQLLMAKAAADFDNDTDNVAVDHAARTVFPSSIFKWYKKDFVNDLRARGRPAERGLTDYVATFATSALRADLERATGYQVEFRAYDGTLNGAQ